MAMRDAPQQRYASLTKIRLYDLAGEDPDRRSSPYCWRIRMALAHKALDFETVPWRFTEKEAIAFSRQGRVPVIVDGDRTVHDSWKIAEYLEEAYADRPLLLPGGRGVAWRERMLDLFDGLARKAKGYAL